ncbi:MAG: DUF3039 domain-containing protein [Corynebacterium variabile]|uniref:DUF3039 domain-containing protein n=1 Tax=Corynebacterium variabile TaxID=1727 RepID=UPI003F923BB6
MTEVRPTANALKVLRKGDQLPESARVAYDAAIAAKDGADENSDLEPILRAWSDAVSTAVAENSLLKDAVTGFTGGGQPSRHKSSSQVTGRTVFEVRDREGAAWRGALVIPEGDDCAWLVHADRHDRFHQSAARVLADMKSAGTLGPGRWDLRVRKRYLEDLREEVQQKDVLSSVVDSLRKAVTPGMGQVRMVLPVAVGGPGGRVEMRVDDVDATTWEEESAHEEPESVMVTLVLPGEPQNQRTWLLQRVVPFLQPDEEMCESLYEDGQLKVQVIMSRARLIHLMALCEEDLEVSAVQQPSQPSVLHYTAKRSLTAAYVQGAAVQAVCGDWWVPVGDTSTHGHLPICPECSREAPFAEAFSAYLRARS